MEETYHGLMEKAIKIDILRKIVRHGVGFMA